MNGLITMRRLGSLGRFGNAMFQKAFLECYASLHNLEVQHGIWEAGERYFGLPRKPVTVNLPEAQEPCIGGDQLREPLPPKGTEYVNKDWVGYGQLHTSWWVPFASYWEKTYQLLPVYAGRCKRALDQLTKSVLIGIHIRRGDYGDPRYVFPIIPVEWYKTWLEEHWDDYGNPRLFIASEDHALVKEFARWAPATSDSLGIAIDDSPIWDWYMLTKCNVLVTPSSSFSFSAGMVSDLNPELYRASLSAGRIVREYLLDAFPVHHQRLADYPHLEGISR